MGPCIRLSSQRGVCLGFSLSLCPSLPTFSPPPACAPVHTHTLSLKQINKTLKERGRERERKEPRKKERKKERKKREEKKERKEKKGWKRKEKKTWLGLAPLVQVNIM